MKAIGIDLGTTNSVMAHCDPQGREPRVLSNAVGENLTPSVVCFKPPREEGGEGEVLVGRTALNYAVRAPNDTILSIKRLMGRDFRDPQIQRVAETFNYRVVPGPGGDPRAHVELGGETLAPAAVSAMILRQIRRDASRALGEEVGHAVITVPAYFNEGQRAATREAGEQAGLVVKRIIDEPVAAAVAFGVDSREGDRHRILVYDLGGGTFDISILQMVRDDRGRNQFEVLKTKGDTWLGGDDFDRHLLTRMIATVEEQAGESPTGDPRFLLLARRHAEEAKRALSRSAETYISIPGAYRTSKGVLIDLELTARQEELEAAIREAVEHTIELVLEALKDQGLTPDDLSDVLLVGGATLTPAVERAVVGLFGEGKVRRGVNPMECVAVGASILAATLHGVECPNSKCRKVNDETAEVCTACDGSLASARSVGDTGIGDVTSMSLGIAAVKDGRADVFVPIIPRDTPYPLHEPMKKRFRATQRSVRVPVYEGEDSIASRNAEQGVIVCELPEELEPESEVDVSFNYDRNRTLTVMLSVPGTDFFEVRTLSHDQPRSEPAAGTAGDVEEEEAEDWQNALGDTLEFTQGFLERYEPYIDTAQAMKLQQEIDRARQLLFYPDEVEGRRIKRLLEKYVFGCGLATQLFVAESAVDGASSDEAKEIREAANQVRQHHQSGQRELAAEKARLLKVLVAKQLERRAGYKQAAGEQDWGGLLRLLRD